MEINPFLDSEGNPNSGLLEMAGFPSVHSQVEVLASVDPEASFLDLKDPGPRSWKVAGKPHLMRLLDAALE